MKIWPFLLAALPALLAPLRGAPDQTPTPTPPPAVAIDPVLQMPNLWNTTPQQLLPDLARMHFAWTSMAQDTARSARHGLTFGSQALNEALLRFRNGKLSEVTLMYFDRGDAGELREDEFEKLVATVSSELTTLTGQQPVDLGRDAASAVKAEGREWDTAASRYLLEWSVTKKSITRSIPFRAEFVRLTIQPRTATSLAIGAATPAAGSRAAVSRFVAADHIERRPNGDVLLKDVPMVDQGQKGYCVVASVERVMRYYGADVDQHELAQIANSDAAKGTSTDAMIDSLKKLTARLGVRVRSISDWDIRDFLRMVDEYNRATRHGKVAPEVTLSGNMIEVSEVFAKMQPELYKQVRMKKTSDFGRFQREIQRSIDDGVPLLWSVWLGLVKEKEIPQVFGGHMRLIIGYNAKTGEVIYSDSWGMGHEEKRMPWDDAWTITTGLSALLPLST